MGSVDGLFHGHNDDRIEGLLLGSHWGLLIVQCFDLIKE